MLLAVGIDVLRLFFSFLNDNKRTPSEKFGRTQPAVGFPGRNRRPSCENETPMRADLEPSERREIVSRMSTQPLQAKMATNSGKAWRMEITLPRMGRSDEAVDSVHRDDGKLGDLSVATAKLWFRLTDLGLRRRRPIRRRMSMLWPLTRAAPQRGTKEEP